MEKPNYEFSTVYDGFSFGIYWDTNRRMLVCCMSYTPSWPHCHFIYGQDVEQFIENAKARIAEDKKIYKNGGKYPEDYYER